MVDKEALRERLKERSQRRYDARQQGVEMPDDNPGAIMDRELLGSGVRSVEAPSSELNYQEELDLDPNLPEEVKQGVLENRMTKEERLERVGRLRRMMVRSNQRGV